MRTASVTIVVLIFAALFAWEFVPLQYTIWDGGFDLTVNVSSTVGPLRSVSCKPCIQREDAEWVFANSSHPEARSCSTVADPFDGKPILVYVPMSGRESPCGRELWRRQWKYLVVIGILQDGREFSKLVELPDYRNASEVSVSVP